MRLVAAATNRAYEIAAWLPDTCGDVGVSEAEPIVGPSLPVEKVAENSTVVLAWVAVTVT
jgi:hypothetical protein